MTPTRDLGLELARSEGSSSSAQRPDVKLRAAGQRPASSGAPLAAHPIMPLQVARRRANSRCRSRLGRREKRRRTVNFNDELAGVFAAANEMSPFTVAPGNFTIVNTKRLLSIGAVSPVKRAW